MNCRDFKNTIQLKNDGQLSLFFLGTGSAFTKKNFQNNIIVVKGDFHVLIDCGTLCPYSFSTFNSKITDIENILITHSHADHIGGLEEVALMNMYITKRRPKMILTDEYKKILWENSLKGGLSLRGEDGIRQKMTFDDYFEQIKPVQIKKAPRPFCSAKIGELDLKIFRTKHLFAITNNWKNSYYSVGVLIDNRVLFTGDSKNDPELINWISSEYKLDAIFHDCQFGYNAVHAQYSELKDTIPEELKSKTLLCHYNDGSENTNVKKDGFAGLVRRGVYYEF